MWQHITILDLLSNNQHGFRKRFRTTTQLLDVIHHAARALSEHKIYHIVSFDFDKAFDKVPHHLLLHKLNVYRFHENAIKWIEGWLLERASVVTVNGMSSRSFFKNGFWGPSGFCFGAAFVFNLYKWYALMCTKFGLQAIRRWYSVGYGRYRMRADWNTS